MASSTSTEPEPSRALTFGEIDARASRMAHELSARGIARSDRLCVHLPNGVEFIDLYLACVRLGVIFVPMNVLYRERELRHIVSDAEPRAVVVDPASDATYPGEAVLWDVAELSLAAAGRDVTRPSAALDGDDPALIVYTSGTTGTAKGAVLTHNNLAANAMTLTRRGRSPRPTATSRCCRSFTCTDLETAFTVG